MFATFMEVARNTTVVNVSSCRILPAAWRRRPRTHLGAHRIPRRQRHRPSHDRVARGHVLVGKRLLLMSITGFTISSFLCGAAPSLALLVIFRIIRAPPGARQPLFFKPCCSKPSSPRNADARWASGDWGLWWRRSWDSSSADGSPRTTAGGGCSTCRRLHCSDHHDAAVCVRFALICARN